jgi:gluconokinase
MVAVVVVMGVTGVGKTTVAQALAARLAWTFVEADALHSRANVEKMARGEPLSDADRGPWLAAVATRIREVGGERVVVACSALKRKYREVLEGAAASGETRFVLLEAPPEVVRRRIEGRKGHFAKATLLASQEATLERTSEVVEVDATMPVDEIVEAVVAKLFEI